MNNYTEKDLAAFEAKDRRITKLSCLTRATDIVIALWTHPAVKSLDVNTDKLKTDSAKQICELADVFVNWVYETNKPISVIPSIAETVIEKKQAAQLSYNVHVLKIPTPTLEQKQLFEQLAKDTGLTYDFVLQQIWERKQSLVIEPKQIPSCIKYLKGLKNV